MPEIYQIVWVAAKIYEEASGLSRRTINRIIARGEWQQGVHYNYKGRKLLINLKEADKWAATIPKSDAT